MSGIVINITAGTTREESSVIPAGQIYNVIKDSERASFGIATDADLKRAVGKYFGKEPNDAFLHSPTVWGNLYKTYNWQQVQRVLQVKRAEITDISNKPTILATETLKNNSQADASFHSKIFQQVTDSVSTEWSNSSKVSVEGSITYNVGLPGTGVGGGVKFGFESTWGKNETKSMETTVGWETGVTVLLKPGQSAVVELSASRGTMRVRITYEAYLRGMTVINYNPRYQDHHFWALDIGSVLGDSNKVEIVEDVDMLFYSKGSVQVKDGKTNEKMNFYMAAHAAEDPSENQGN